MQQTNYSTKTANGLPQDIAGAADYYLQNGASIIPVKSDKRPNLNGWLQYQKTPPTPSEIKNWFAAHQHGIGVIGGEVSGNLVCLDIDCKYDQTGEMMKEFCEIVKDHDAEFFRRLVIAKTVNGGYHVLFRITGEPVTCDKLAQRPATAVEIADRPTQKIKDLIETKAQGGYFLVEPTPGYKFMQGGFSCIPLITRNELDFLLAVARSFDQMPAPNETSEAAKAKQSASGGLSPLDDYNQRGEVRGLLERHGWKVFRHSGERIIFTRPGTTNHPASANYHTGLKVFYPFTTSTGFEAGKGYSPAGVYTVLEHGGDFSAAARQLLKDGYGERIESKPKPEQQAAATDFNQNAPKELPKTNFVTPELSPELIPECWREWLTDIADRLQCPLDFAAVSALVSAATVIGNKIRIRPKQNDSWLIAPNLWGAVVANPGALKSPAVREGKIFLDELAKRERVRFEESLKDAEFEKEYNEAKRAELKKDATKNSYTKEQYKEKFDALQTLMPTEKRLFTSDSTVEKLGELLNENPHGIGIFRDELTGWLKMLDRSGHEQDRAFYLECWNGDGTFTFDRIGRGTTHIKNLTVSLFGTIQPAMIETYLRGSIEGGSDDGLIQRFQVLVYPNAPKTFKYVDAPPKGRERARQIFYRLYDDTPDLFGAKWLTAEAGGQAFLQFDNEAQDFFQGWLTELEIALRSDTFGTSALESHLAKYRSLMPTLALIFHLIDFISTDGKGKSAAVGLQSAQLAAAWCGYLQKHAEKLYNSVLMSDFDVAHEILKRIAAKQIAETFTARDIYGNHWRNLSSPETVKAGLNVLVEYGYLFQTLIETGGRAKMEYTIHESLR